MSVLWRRNHAVETMAEKNLISKTFLEKRHAASMSLLTGLSPKQILDVGCGEGEFLSRLALFFPKAKLEGCDPDPNAIKQAKLTCSGATYFCTDFMKLGHLSNESIKPQYDLICFLEVLEHADDI